MTRDEVIERAAKKLTELSGAYWRIPWPKTLVRTILNTLQPGDEVGEGLVVTTSFERTMGQTAIEMAQKTGDLT